MWSKRIFPVLFISTVLLILVVCLYYFQMKQNFHIDELYTYGLSNSYFEPFPFDKNQWLSGDYYQNYLSPTLETRFSYDSVYYNQTQDVHPPLYYWLIHTIASFFPGVFSKWIGLSLNLGVHLLTFGMLFALLKRYTQNRWIALFGAAFWALSVGALSSANFIRMYHLLGLLQITLLYLSLGKKFSKKTLVGVALVCFLGGLTHYYFYLYAFSLVLTTCLLLLCQNRIRDMFSYGLSALLGVVGALAGFPAVFTHLTATNRGQEVMANLDDAVFSNSNPFVVFIKQELFLGIRLRYLVIAGIVLGLLVCISLWRTKKLSPVWLLVGSFLPVVAYIMIVQQVSHYQTPRYIYSVYPAITAGLFLLVYNGFKGIFQQQKVLVFLVGVLAVGGIGWSLWTEAPDYLYAEHVTLQSLVEAPEEQTIFVLGDAYWKVSQVVAEVKEFKSIYPSIITNSLTNLPDEMEVDSFYVLMLPHEKNNYERVMQDIAKKYGFMIESKVEIETDRILYYLVEE